MAQKVCDALNKHDYSSIDGLQTFLTTRVNKRIPHPMPVHNLDIWELFDAILPSLSPKDLEFALTLTTELQRPWAQHTSFHESLAEQDPPIKPDILVSVKPVAPKPPGTEITISIYDDDTVIADRIVEARRRRCVYEEHMNIYNEQMLDYNRTVQYMRELEQYNSYLKQCEANEMKRIEMERYNSEGEVLDKLNDQFEEHIELMSQYALYVLVHEKDKIVASDPQDRTGKLRQLVEAHKKDCDSYPMRFFQYKASRLTSHGLRVDDIILHPNIQYGEVEIHYRGRNEWIETYDGGGSGFGQPRGYTEYVRPGSEVRRLDKSVFDSRANVQCTFAVDGNKIVLTSTKPGIYMEHAYAITIIRPIIIEFTKA